MKRSLQTILLLLSTVVYSYNVLNAQVTAVKFNYLGQYNALGVPDNLEETNDIIGQDFLNDINTALPEKKPVPDFHPEYIAQKNETDIVLNAPTDLWITFVNEAAGYTNALGYYTYPVSNPPKSVSDIKMRWIIFPNVSLDNSGGGLKSGNKVFLGNFDANTAIGWFVVADAFKDGKLTQGKYIVYSEPNLNAEKDASLKAHTVLLKDAKRNKLVLGFEDVLRDQGSDQDFNDLIFYITASSYNSINTTDVVSIDGNSSNTTSNPSTSGNTGNNNTTTSNPTGANTNNTNNATNNTNININNNVNNNGTGGSNTNATNTTNNVNTGTNTNTNTNSNNTTTNSTTTTNSNNTTTVINNTTIINKTGGGGGNKNGNTNANTNVNNNTNNNGTSTTGTKSGNNNSGGTSGTGSNSTTVVSNITVCNRDGIAQSNFNTLKATIKAQSVESNKPMVIKQAVKTKKVTVSQVKEIIKLIVVEQYKLDMAKYLFDFTCDKSNYYELNALLLPSRARELDEYLKDKNMNDDNFTSVNSSVTNGTGSSTNSQTQTKPVDNTSTSYSSGNILCDNGRMPYEEFDDIKESINSKAFSDTKITVLKEAMPSRCINSVQVKEIMGLFSFETDKMTVAKYLYKFTTDKQNYYKVNDGFSFSSSIDELKEYIKSGK